MPALQLQLPSFIIETGRAKVLPLFWRKLMAEEKKKRARKVKEVQDNETVLEEENKEEPILENKIEETYDYVEPVLESPKKEIKKAQVISVLQSGQIIYRTLDKQYKCVQNIWGNVKSGDEIEI
jgi:hypothetical protein